jgi:hypothetical protein
MTEIFAPSNDTLKKIAISEQDYRDMYAQSIKDPDKFWGAMAKRLTWIKEPTKSRTHRSTRPFPSNGTRTASSTRALTASTVICRRKKILSRSSGKATNPATTAKSPTAR